MADNVNHPSHYEKSTSFECIEVMRLLLGREGIIYFCMGNAFKYMWRYKNKNGYEDLEKAKWYLDYAEETENISSCLDYRFGELFEDMYSLLNQKIDNERNNNGNN